MLRSHDLSVVIQVYKNVNKRIGACLLHHNWSGKGISHNNTTRKHVSVSRGNIWWIRLLKVSLKQHWSTYTLTRIIAEQVMYKKTLQGWGGGGPQSLWSHLRYSVPTKAGPLAKLEGWRPTQCRARDYCKGKWNHTDQWAEDCEEGKDLLFKYFDPGIMWNYVS